MSMERIMRFVGIILFIFNVLYMGTVFAGISLSAIPHMSFEIASNNTTTVPEIPPLKKSSLALGTPFSLTSSAVASSGPLPVQYTCDGKNISPQLSWQAIPEKTRSFALIMSDPDAPNGVWYHWILYNLPAGMTKLAVGMQNFPKGVKVGSNSYGKLAYNGPCPPPGAIHHYIFTLYALDKKLDLPIGLEARALLKAMKGHILDQTEFTATYARIESNPT